MNRKHPKKRRKLMTPSENKRKRTCGRISAVSSQPKDIMVAEAIKELSSWRVKKQKRRSSASNASVSLKSTEYGEIRIYSVPVENLSLQAVLKKIDKTSKKVAKRSWFILKNSVNGSDSDTAN